MMIRILSFLLWRLSVCLLTQKTTVCGCSGGSCFFSFFFLFLFFFHHLKNCSCPPLGQFLFLYHYMVTVACKNLINFFFFIFVCCCWIVCFTSASYISLVLYCTSHMTVETFVTSVLRPAKGSSTVARPARQSKIHVNINFDDFWKDCWFRLCRGGSLLI